MWSQLNWQTSLNHPAFQLDNRKDNDGVVFASIAYGRPYAHSQSLELSLQATNCAGHNPPC